MLSVPTENALRSVAFTLLGGGNSAVRGAFRRQSPRGGAAEHNKTFVDDDSPYDTFGGYKMENLSLFKATPHEDEAVEKFTKK